MKILLYDDTFEGLLTLIYDAFYLKNSSISIYSKNEFNLPFLLGEIVEINTDEVKFRKVKEAIIKKIDYLCLKKIYMVYLSNVKDKGTIIFKYLKTAFKLGNTAHNFLNIDIIRLVDDISKKVSLESHAFKGFVRFNYIDNKFLYSAIEPDNDILELIADHFKKRFSNECFIIHDISREKALIYNRFFYEIIFLSTNDYLKLSSHKDEYSNLWKEYFKSTNIDERKNTKLQIKMMPKRYWRHILETKE